jgi:hypothetical protein
VLGDAERIAAPLATLSTVEQMAAPGTGTLEAPEDVELPPPTEPSSAGSGRG